MVTIHFLPDNRSVSVPRGTTILAAARLAGVTIESPCNGAVVCGKCAVHLSHDSLRHVQEKGAHLLPRRERLRGQVLACAAEVYGDIAVEVPTLKQERDLKIASHGEAVAVTLAPYIAKEFCAERGVTSVYGGSHLLSEEEGDTSDDSFGVVVDKDEEAS